MLSTYNYSLYSIPAYLALAMYPHAYSVYLVTSANNNQWSHASPRSTVLASTVKQSVPAACYAKYERCRAAHSNMLENMAFVVGAVLAGNMAKLDAKFMNITMGVYSATRLGYLMAYVQTEKEEYSQLRTVFYLAGSVALTVIYWKAAQVLGQNGAA